MTQDMPTGGPGPEAGQPSEEELRAALEEQMRHITVEDVLVQTLVTLVNLAGRRLGLGAPAEEAAGERDPEQARLAIEGVRALLPLVPGDVEPIRQALTQLQMAYAQEMRAGAGAAPDEAGAGAQGAGQPPAGGPGEPDTGADPAGGGPAEDPERAKARAKIWTPPGA